GACLHVSCQARGMGGRLGPRARGAPGAPGPGCAARPARRAHDLPGLRRTPTPRAGQLQARPVDAHQRPARHPPPAGARAAGADVLIYVLSATEPLSADELDTIEGLWNGGHRTILFAVNYANRLDEEDLPAVWERFAGLLRAYGPPGDAVPLFFVAARPALLARERGDMAALAASGLPALHDALGRLAAAAETAPLRRARLRRLCAAARTAEDQAVAA